MDGYSVQDGYCVSVTQNNIFTVSVLNGVDVKCFAIIIDNDIKTLGGVSCFETVKSVKNVRLL